MIDLHTHSTVSDGIKNPIELILYAKQKNLSCIALTDHDSLAGLADASKTASSCGITFVPGVELNVDFPSGEFHLLGLGVSANCSRLLDLCVALQKNRAVRNRAIIDKMAQDGFAVDYDELVNFANTQCVGRPHFAHYLVEKKIVKNRQSAFDKFLAKGKPYFVPKAGCNLEEGIVAIKESGGVPVLAHPLSLYVSFGKLPALLDDFKERGIEGIEAYHPGARLADCKRLEQIARDLGLFVTAGSDYHGETVRKDRKLGYTAGDLVIDERFWQEELKPAIKF